jgi:hypothetical protein
MHVVWLRQFRNPLLILVALSLRGRTRPWSLDARRERREPRDSREDVSIRGVRRSTTLQGWVKTEFKLGRMIPAVYSVKEAEQYSPGLS